MNWSKLAGIILRYRIFFLIVIVGLTALMTYQVSRLDLDYGYSGLMPDSDSVSINLEEFKREFGGDATLFLMGVEDSNFFALEKFNDWNSLRRDLLKIEGIESAFSVSQCVSMEKSSNGKFEFLPVFSDNPDSQAELDSMVSSLYNLPIYEDLLYSGENNVFLMVLTMDSVLMNTSARQDIVEETLRLTHEWGDKYGLEIHFSGLPYVRAVYMKMIKTELGKFLYLAGIVTFVLLLLFFRSFKTAIPSLVVVGMGVLWALGSIGLFGLKISVLTGMIPTIIIIIGVPNCVFLINKYHQEYRKHKNKEKALQKAIEKVGSAIFLTNITTAVGFATFMVINNRMLSGFGLIASLNIMILFILSILLIPIIFSLLPPPTDRQIKHLDHRFISRIIKGFTGLILNYRKLIYLAFVVLLCLSGWGISKMKITGYIVDDLHEGHPLYSDLKFFEKSVGGVMPLEISVDTKKPNGVLRTRTLTRANDFQEKLATYPELSRSLSIVDGLKFARQAYFKGDKKHYKLPGRQEQNFIIRSFDESAADEYLLRMLLDSTRQKMRINVRVADIGVQRMMILKDSIMKDLDHYFPPDEYKAILTGSSLTFTLGTHYLVRNLFVSLGLAIILISLFMAWMFSSKRMVLISIFPNLLPLLITAGIMGFFSISIRPSTILIYSIAFGISVDTAIHFLAQYRQELANSEVAQDQAVINALKEVGVSIIYTVIILFFGFGIFVASEFGGTMAMGVLTAITLFVAMLANLLLVPAILVDLAHKKELRI